jgi:sporulation protein YlmC with PRC-barrel domain
MDAVEGKEVISCSEGTKLGRADAIIVDSKTLILEAIELSGAPAMSAASILCVPLMELNQIGDVVLVRNAACRQPSPRLRGFLKLLKLPVKDEAGVQSILQYCCQGLLQSGSSNHGPSFRCCNALIMLFANALLTGFQCLALAGGLRRWA